MTQLKIKNSSPAIKFSRFPQASDLFSDFFDSVSNFDLNRNNVPAVNIIENDSEFRIEVAAPGLTKEDFKVNVDDDVITISGEKKSESEQEDERYTRKEFSYTSFQRTFSIPDFIEHDGISANYVDGLMKISLPKMEEAKKKGPKEIKVS